MIADKIRPLVLAIDDDPDSLRVLRNLLDSCLDVHLSESIKQARDLIDVHQFDLILLDLEFVDESINGLGFLSELQLNERTRALPIVIVTAHMSQVMEIRCRLAGASDFVGKPLDPTRFLDRVGWLTRLKRSPLPSDGTGKRDIIIQVGHPDTPGGAEHWLRDLHPGFELIVTPSIDESEKAIESSRPHPRLILVDGASRPTDTSLARLKVLSDRLKIPVAVVSESEDLSLERRTRMAGLLFKMIGNNIALQRARMNSLLQLTARE